MIFIKTVWFSTHIFATNTSVYDMFMINQSVMDMIMVSSSFCSPISRDGWSIVGKLWKPLRNGGLACQQWANGGQTILKNVGLKENNFVGLLIGDSMLL